MEDIDKKIHSNTETVKMLIGTKTSTTRMDKWVATCSYNGTSYKQRWKNYCYMAQYEWPQKYNVLRKKQIAEKFILNGSISYLYFKIKHYLGTYICVYIWMYVCVCVYIYMYTYSTYSGEGHGNPLQCSCLENSMDRAAWWATVHGVTQSQTWLSNTTPCYL